MRKPVFFLAWMSVMVTFGVLSGLAAVQAEDCYLDNLKPGLWRFSSENNIFLEQDRDFVVEPDGLTYWPDPIRVNIDLDDMACTYNGEPDGSIYKKVDPVIKQEDMRCNGNLGFYDKGWKTDGPGTFSWEVSIIGNISSDIHIEGSAHAQAVYAVVDDKDPQNKDIYICDGEEEEYWTADWAEEIGPPDAPSLISYPATAKPGERIRISWSSVPSVAKIYYVLERDKSASFENPTILYSGNDNEFSDNTAGESVNSEQYQYYYRVKAVTAFGESEWKTGNAVSFCNPEEIVQLYSQVSVDHGLIGIDNFAYYRIYVPPGVSCISVEDNISGERSHWIYLRHKYIPTDSNYDAVKKEHYDIVPCKAQVDGKYGYWYIGLFGDGFSGGGKITATNYDNCSIPYTPQDFDDVRSAYVYDRSAYVAWGAVENAESYILEIAPDDTFKDSRRVYAGPNNWFRFTSWTDGVFGEGMVSKSYFCRAKSVNGNFSSNWRVSDDPMTVSLENVRVLQNNVEAEFPTQQKLAAYFVLEVPHGAKNLKIVLERSLNFGILSAKFEYWPSENVYDYKNDEPKKIPNSKNSEWVLDFSCSNKHGYWYFSYWAEYASSSGGNWITATYTGDCLAPISPANIDYPGTDSDGSFQITWSGMSGVSKYVLERDTKSDFSSPSQVYSGTATSFNEKNLSEGTYYYRVRADNSCGNGLWRVGYPIEVKHPLPPAPTAAFSASPTKGTAPLKVDFTDQSTGEVTARYWEFGDDQSSLDANPTHTYADVGTYTVKYTVNGPGGYDIETKTNYIVVENPTIPTVSTTTPSSITHESVKTGGTVSSNGGAQITERGVCYGTALKPDTSGDHIADGTGADTFAIEITGLNPATTYHVRAYAGNSLGTAYGSDKSFTTDATTPTVTTRSVSDISDTSAKTGGDVTFNGGADVTEKGICWSDSKNPSIDTNVVPGGSGNGPFSCTITGLQPSTQYYVRAYAKNKKGTAYGEEHNFTTKSGTKAPTVTTAAISDITQNSAKSGGNVTSDGGASVTERGICWSTATDPDLDDDYIRSGNGTGPFISTFTGLIPDTRYYVRAYATNSEGTGYGENIEFTTTAVNPWPIAVSGGLPDTGQIQCYDNDAEITCPEPGESFYGQDANYLINPPSYTKLDANGKDLPDAAKSWVMVRDNVTGLIWEVKQNRDGVPHYDDPHDADNGYTWYDDDSKTNGGEPGTPGEGTDTKDFIKKLNNAGFGGYSDWRMPTFKELDSLTDLGRRSYAIDPAYFPVDCPGGNRYWSATTTADYPSFAWYVDPCSGSDGFTSKSFGWYVRAVRGGQIASLDRLITNGDGTVTDKSTGLMWQQNAPQNPMDWNSAISYCENLSDADYQDWRLPNTRELRSIVEYDLYDPAINSASFEGPASESYWSSTGDGAWDAWTIYFFSGEKNNGWGKENDYYVRAVRGGQRWFLDHLIILAPGQGSVWPVGNTMSIRWDTAEIAGDVTISISRKGGKAGTFETLVNKTENDGTYDWVVTGSESVNCVLKIEPLSDAQKGTNQGLFTIQAPAVTLPTVETKPVTEIGASTAKTGGDVLSNGGADVTTRGICWDTEPDPTTSNNIIPNGNGLGEFTSTVTNLDPNTVYHVRAYATNSVGTGYGQDISFTTAYSGTHYVNHTSDCGTKSPCHATIQEAVDAAKSGSAVYIAEGRYDEVVTLNDDKSLILSGGWDGGFTEQSRGETIIKAPKAPKGALTLRHVVVKP